MDRDAARLRPRPVLGSVPRPRQGRRSARPVSVNPTATAREVQTSPSRVLPDGSTAWKKIPGDQDAFVAVSIGVFDQLTWNTYSAYHVVADLLTGEVHERRFTK